jgi:signal transduction histidine kinase
VLIHDPRVSADPAIRAAIARAAELATINARLQSEAREEVLAVGASRLRILQAADDERRDLDARLREGIEPRLNALEAEIAGAEDQAPDTDAMLGEALAELEHTRLDLAGVTEDLHPRILDERGLRGALEALASRGPIPVTLEWHGVEPVDAGTRTALYFVCSEGLANVTKHAEATHVRVSLTSQETRVVLEIDDDGHGGASLAGGTGLQGLRDRLETLGGTLVVDSPFDTGTHLIATLPARLEA